MDEFLPASGVIVVSWYGIDQQADSEPCQLYTPMNWILSERDRLRDEGNEQHARRLTRVLTMLRRTKLTGSSWEDLAAVPAIKWMALRNMGQEAYDTLADIILTHTGKCLPPWSRRDKLGARMLGDEHTTI